MSDKKRVCIALAAVAAVCLAGLAGVHVALQALFGPTPEYRKGAVWQELKLKWYIQTHSQVALGEVLTFEWEEAYVDRMPYGTGESVRQLTGYEFEVEELNDESWNRLVFQGRPACERAYLFLVRVEIPRGTAGLYASDGVRAAAGRPAVFLHRGRRL